LPLRGICLIDQGIKIDKGGIVLLASGTIASGGCANIVHNDASVSEPGGIHSH